MAFFVTSGFIITIFNPHFNNKSSKLSGDLNKSISTSSELVVSTAAHVKDFNVVVEDIFFSCVAVKIKMLNTCLENTHITSSYFTKGERLLKGLSMKTPIAWGKANDNRWAQQDDVVLSKLKKAGPSSSLKKRTC